MGIFFSRKRTEEREKPQITEQDKAVLVGLDFNRVAYTIEGKSILKG